MNYTVLAPNMKGEKYSSEEDAGCLEETSALVDFIMDIMEDFLTEREIPEKLIRSDIDGTHSGVYLYGETYDRLAKKVSDAVSEYKKGGN